VGFLAFALTVALGRASGAFVVAFLLLAFALGTALSVAAIGLEELTFRRYPHTSDLGKLMLTSVVEAVGYHQLSTWWRLRGLWAALRQRGGWGEMTRKGFATAPTADGGPG
jgi:Na+/alanine symporter